MSMEQITPSAHDDPERLALGHLASLVQKEAELLMQVLPDALDRQWEGSHSSASAGGRAQGTISDPTADLALDPRRLQVRGTVIRSRRALFIAAVTLRGVRRAMERAIQKFDAA